MANEGTAAVIEMLGNTITNLQQQLETAHQMIADLTKLLDSRPIPVVEEVEPNDHKAP